MTPPREPSSGHPTADSVESLLPGEVEPPQRAIVAGAEVARARPVPVDPSRVVDQVLALQRRGGSGAVLELQRLQPDLSIWPLRYLHKTASGQPKPGTSRI